LATNNNLRRTGSGGGVRPISADASVPLPAGELFLPPISGAADIGLATFRVLILLIWHCWDGIRSEPRRRRVAVGVLRDYAVVGRHHGSTDQLRGALGELIKAGFATTASDDGAAIRSDAPIILHMPTDLSLSAGAVEFSLSAAGAERFALAGVNPRFIRLPLPLPRGVPSIQAARLCLMLLQYPGRRNNSFDVVPSELCDRIGVPPDSSYRRNFAALAARVIRPALTGIARRTGDIAEYRTLRTSGRGKVHEIRFTVMPKTARAGKCLDTQERDVGTASTPAANHSPRADGGHLVEDDWDSIDREASGDSDGYIYGPSEDEDDSE